MSDSLEVKMEASGASEVQLLTSALDQLRQSINDLGHSSTSLSKLEQQMKVLTATTDTGFREVATQLDKFQAKVKEASATTTDYAAKRLAASQSNLAAERAALSESAKLTQKALDASISADKARTESALGYSAKRLADSQKNLADSRAITEARLAYEKEATQRQDIWLHDQKLKQAADTHAEALKMNEVLNARLAYEKEATQRQDIWLRDQRLKQAADTHAEALKMNEALNTRLAYEKEATQRQDIWLHDQKLKQAADTHAEALKMNETLNARLAYEKEATQRQDIWLHDQKLKQVADTQAQLEKQRALNASFLSASPSSQLHTATQAQAYSSLGGNASAKYGSAASGVAGSATEYAKLKAAASASADAIRTHNLVMSEGHAFARGFSGALGQLWITYGQILPLLAGVALAGSIKAAIEGFAAVELQMTLVKALSEDTTNSVHDLTSAMHEVAGALGIAPEAAGKGLRLLTQAGLDAGDALATLPAVFKLSQVGELDLSAAITAGTSVMNAYGMEAKDLGGIGDIIAKAAAVSAASVSSITESMKYSAGTAKNYGVTMIDLATTLTALGKRGIIGSSAGVATNNLIQETYAPSSEKAKRALKELGVTAYDVTTGLRKNFFSVIQDISVKLGAFNQQSQGALLEALYGKKGEKAFFALTQMTQAELEKIQTSVAESAGFVDKVFTEKLGTVQGQFDLTKSAVSNMFSKLGEESSASIVELMSNLRQFVSDPAVISAFVGLAQSIVKVGEALVYVGVPAAALFAAFKAGQLVIWGFTAAMQGAAAASALLSATNPILLILVGTITLLGAAYALTRENKDKLFAKADADNTSILDTISSIEKETDALDKQIVKMHEKLGMGNLLEAAEKSKAEASVHNLQSELTAQEAIYKQELQRARSAPSGSTEAWSANLRAGKAKTRMDDIQHPLTIAKANLGSLAIAEQNRKSRQDEVNFLNKMLGRPDPKETIGTQNATWKEDKAAIIRAENDAFKAQIQLLQNVIDLRKQASSFKLEDIANSVKMGSTGTVDGAYQTFNEKAAATRDEIALMQEQIAITEGEENKKTLRAKIEGAMHQQVMQDLQNRRVLDQTIATEKLSMSEKLAKNAADSAAADGNFAAAAAMQWEADFGREKKRLQNELEAATEREGTYVMDEEHIRGLNDSLDALAKDRKIKIDAGSLKELSAQFAQNLGEADAAMAKMQTQAQLGGGGLESVLQVNKTAADIQQNLLPTLEEAVAAMKLINPNLDTTAFDKAIAKMRKGLDSLTKSPMAAMFRDISKTLAGLNPTMDRVSKAMGNMAEAFEGLGEVQKNTEKGSAERKYQTIQQYAQMAEAAKGFFAEGSDGMKAMDVVAKALNVTAAIGAILTQGKGDPYTAFARMAAMVAAVASLGISISGAFSKGADTRAEDRQAAAGTGSVFGDSKAKSESILRSMELLGQIQSVALKHTISMDNSLKSLVGDISGLTTQVLQYTVGPQAATNAKYNATTKNQALINLGSGNSSTGVVGMLRAVFNPLGAILSKTTKIVSTVTDQGFTAARTTLGQAQGSGLGVQGYADVNVTKKFLGMTYSNKSATHLTGLPSEVSSQFDAIIKGLVDTVTYAAGTLGMSGDAFTQHLNQFVIDIGNISTKGLTGEQVQKQFEAIFSKMGDDMAQWGVAGLAGLKKTGEGYLETLSRLSQAITTVNGMLSDLGHGLLAVSVEGADAASQLIDLFGGIDNMIAAGSDYFDKYFTDAEKIQKQNTAMSAGFARLGVTMPTTTAAMRKMIEDAGSGASLATEAGRTLYAGLMMLAGGFFDLQTAMASVDTTAKTKAADDAATLKQTQSDAVDKAYATLERSIQAAKDTENLKYNAAKVELQAAITSAEAAVTTAKSNAAAFGSALAAMKITSVALQAQERRYAQSVIMQALATGNTTLTPELQQAMSTVAQPSEQLFSSFEDYARDFYHTSNNIAGLKAVADSQLASAQAQVEGLKSQLNNLDLYHSINLAKLDAQLEEAKSQVDILHGIDNSVIDVGTAMSQLNVALGNAGVAPTVKRDQSLMAGDAQRYFDENAIGSTINWASGILTKLTETTADYFGTMGKHITLTNNAADFSAEALSDPDIYKAWYKQYGYAPKVPGFASGGNHAGGLRMVGEIGREIENTGPSHITNANDTAELMGAAPAEMRKVAEILQGIRDDARIADFEQVKTLKAQLRILEEEKATGKWVRGEDTAPVDVKVIP